MERQSCYVRAGMVVSGTRHPDILSLSKIKKELQEQQLYSKKPTTNDASVLAELSSSFVMKQQPQQLRQKEESPSRSASSRSSNSPQPAAVAEVSAELPACKHHEVVSRVACEPSYPLLCRPSLFGQKPQYYPIREIGTGSFGKALLVRDLSSAAEGKQYVVKVIDTARLGVKERADAINEVQLLASFKHPYIISYKESFIDQSYLCIVMDYADGGDLFRTIAAQRARGEYFSESQILRWFTQATLALKYLHEKHILHRGRLRLGDFGIAKALDRTSAFTKTQIGTPYYLSPEICKNQPYSWASDIWSLGCILYELATLKVPFDAPNITALLNKIMMATPPPIPETYSPKLRQLCKDCLQKEWKRRPSAAAILQRDIIQNEIRAMLVEEQRRRKHRDEQKVDISKPLAETAETPAERKNESSTQNERSQDDIPEPRLRPSLPVPEAGTSSKERKDYQQFLIAGDHELPLATGFTDNQMSIHPLGSTPATRGCVTQQKVSRNANSGCKRHVLRKCGNTCVGDGGPVYDNSFAERTSKEKQSFIPVRYRVDHKLSRLSALSPSTSAQTFCSQSTTADDSPNYVSVKSEIVNLKQDIPNAEVDDRLHRSPRRLGKEKKNVFKAPVGIAAVKATPCPVKFQPQCFLCVPEQDESKSQQALDVSTRSVFPSSLYANGVPSTPSFDLGPRAARRGQKKTHDALHSQHAERLVLTAIRPRKSHPALNPETLYERRAPESYMPGCLQLEKKREKTSLCQGSKPAKNTSIAMLKWAPPAAKHPHSVAFTSHTTT